VCLAGACLGKTSAPGGQRGGCTEVMDCGKGKVVGCVVWSFCGGGAIRCLELCVICKF
jgi:hypothetical protein